MIHDLNVRIYPNKKQRNQIQKTIGYSRFIFNQMLNERKEVYKELKDDKTSLKNHPYKTEKQYKDDIPTAGITGIYAFGDDVRPQEILQDLFRQFSMN